MTVNIREQSRQVQTTEVFSGQMTWKVESVEPDGGAICQMTIDWLRLEAQGGEGEVQVADTRDGTAENKRILQHLEVVTGTPITVHVAKDGSIKSVEGIDQIRNAAPEGISVPKDNEFKESANDLAMVPFAPTQAGIGQTWEASFDWTHEIGTIRHNTTFKFEGVERLAGIDVATVTSTATLSLIPDQDKLPELPDGATVNTELRQASYEAQIMYDLQRGEAVGRNSKQVTEIETAISFNGNTMGQIVHEVMQSQVLRSAEE